MFNPFRYSFQQLAYLGADFCCREMLVGEPNEGNCYCLSRLCSLNEYLLLQTVGLTYLPLHAVTVNSMMEPFLRNANEHLDGFLPLLALSLHIYGP